MGDPIWDTLMLTYLISLLDPSNDDEFDDFVYCFNDILRVDIHIYNNDDGLLIPYSYVRISNQDAEKFNYDPYLHDGSLIDTFRSYDTPKALLPCWDLCEDSKVETFGHTSCLENGQTWELQVEAYADGFVSHADTLVLDNRSTYMSMSFFLDPL
jgi:hypothetical protein